MTERYVIAYEKLSGKSLWLLLLINCWLVANIQLEFYFWLFTK
jgi:hypothetical protein